MPKPIVLGETKYPVSREVMPVEANGHTFYGELLIPQGATQPLPTVICCHGFGVTYRQCENSIGMSLAQSGFAVYCFDFWGGSEHSRSGGSMTEMSIFTERQDLEAVVRQARQWACVDKNNVFVLGQSQGGCVAAITAPGLAGDIRGLILEYSALCIPEDARKRFSSTADIPEVTKAFRHKVGFPYYEKVLDYDIYREIRNYPGPVLIQHGDKDNMVSVSYGQRAAEAYPNAKLHIFPGEVHGFTAGGKKLAAKEIYDFLLTHIQETARRKNDAHN